tara:strand:+ start:531 stop:1049 length:519 start_codon:yes stop_codon:yes gene_type:complete
MRKNLFGEIVVEAEDFAKVIIDTFNKKEHLLITPNPNSKKGFFKDGTETLDKVGFYCIYKNSKPIYVGYSNNSIYHRIARFFGAATDSTTDYEQHAGGKKYSVMFGEDYTCLSVKSCHFDTSNLPNWCVMEDIEAELILLLEPMFNSEVYKRLWVSNNSLSIAQNEFSKLDI